MASKHKVECKCCGMMMVPKTIFSRGIYGGWGVWLGGGNPESSYCPFCLNEGWDGVKVPVEKSKAEKTFLLIKVFVGVSLAYVMFDVVIQSFFQVESDSLFVTVSQWAFALIGVGAYQRLKFSTK